MQNDASRRKPTPADARAAKYTDYNNPPPLYREPTPNPKESPVSPMQQFPSAEILLGGYNSRGNGVQNDKQSQQQRQRLTPPMDDPITTHLLVETALGDSQSYDILPYDDLEALKREDKNLQNRVNTVRRQLALETKVRDAARSLNRLYSRPGSENSKSPPMMLRRTSSGLSSKEVVDKAESQLSAATKKVDELSRELYHLEQRLRQTQMKLLQHTAGILQMTHRGPRDANDMLFAPGGGPDSPASLDEDFDRGFDRGLDNLDGFLDELKADKPKGARMSKIDAREASRQEEAFLNVGRQLEDLNERMREMIAQINPQKAESYKELPRIGPESQDIDATVTQQLEHLSRGLNDIQVENTARLMSNAEMQDMEERYTELGAELQASLQENLSLEEQKNQLEDDVSGQLRNLNNELYDILTSYTPNESVPSIPFNSGPTPLMRYTEDRLTNVKSLLQSLSEAAQASRSNFSHSAQYETTLEGLWQIILAGEEESRERKRDERSQLAAKRSAGKDVDSDDDLSPDEDDDLVAEFSLQAFSTKVQWLVSKSTYMEEKQRNLCRKVKQHRDTARSRAVDTSVMEDLKTQHESTTAELEARIRLLEEGLENVAAEAQDEARIASAELQAKLEEAETRAQSLENRISAIAAEREAADRSHTEQEQGFRRTENELRELESEVVRLTTELTITKAELDAAYGSRSQRKADAAAAANSEASARLQDANARVVDLTAQVDLLRKARDNSKGLSEKEGELKKELAETLKEFEELAKASVEAERERDELEANVDGMREKIEGLEGQLAEEKVKWLGMGEDGKGGPQESRSAMVLKNEFKKMMRETRQEHMKALRAEQDERRRLETIVRTIRKDGPGKSGLSYATNA